MLTVPPFNLALLLEERDVLVIGSGVELERRVLQFKQAGARVRVVSGTDLRAERRAALIALSGPGTVEVLERGFVETDLDSVWLGMLVDEDRALAQRIAEACERRQVFFCAVDQPESCSFFQQAVARDGLVTAAFSTAGQAPGLAGRLKAEAEAVMQRAQLGRFAAELAELRDALPLQERRSVLGALTQQVRWQGEVTLPLAALQAARRSAEDKEGVTPDGGWAMSQATPGALSIEGYDCPGDGVFPGSRYCVLVYRAIAPRPNELTFEHLFARHGWTNAWRNGLLAEHHFHSTAHEALGVYRGSVELRVGGDGGPRLRLSAGDVCVIPAGVAHKNEGQSADLRVLGAYPEGTCADICYGADALAADAKQRCVVQGRALRVPLPTRDPCSGTRSPLLLQWVQR